MVGHATTANTTQSVKQKWMLFQFSIIKSVHHSAALLKNPCATLAIRCSGAAADRAAAKGRGQPASELGSVVCRSSSFLRKCARSRNRVIGVFRSCDTPVQWQQGLARHTSTAQQCRACRHPNSFMCTDSAGRRLYLAIVGGQVRKPCCPPSHLVCAVILRTCLTRPSTSASDNTRPAIHLGRWAEPVLKARQKLRANT
jgi:hypothetical protein